MKGRAEESPQVVVVPVTRDGQSLEPLTALVGEVERVLSSRAVSHLSSTEAAALFERRHSRGSAAMSSDALEHFARDANRALVAASNRDWPLAISLIRAALESGESSLVAMNRNQRTAEQLFQACLLAVQALAESGDLQGARAQALECRVRSPGMELADKDRSYEEVVRRLLSDARLMLEQERAAPIVVESDRRCPVLINGRRLGETEAAAPGIANRPFRFEHPARRPYLVQVDCDGQPGRVHVVVPGEETSPLYVDIPFERAVDTDQSSLSLHYEKDGNALLRRHIRQLLSPQILGAAHALLVTHAPNGRLALQRSGGSEIFLDATYVEADVEAAVSKLLDPVLEGPPSDDTQSRNTHADDGPQGPGRGPAIWEKVAGLTMLTGGVALTATSFWADHQRHVRGERYFDSDPDESSYLALGRKWSDARTKPYKLGAAGAGLSLVSTLWLSLRAPARTLPWWAEWGAGAIGAGLATWGLVDVAQGSACSHQSFPDTRLCARQRNLRDRGALLIMASAPGLSLFIVSLSRLGRDRSSSARLFVVPRVALRSAGLEIGLRL